MNIRSLLEQPRELFEQYCKSQVTYAYLGERRALTRVLGKYLLYVDPLDTSIAPHLITEGFWEAWITLALSRLKGDGIAIDVGANQGYFTMVLSELFEEVRAYEPQGDLARMVQDSAYLNGFRGKTYVWQAAVGDFTGMVALRSPEGEPKNRGSAYVEVEIEPGEHVVDVHRLDDLILGRVGFIKIDAEGSEKRVWDGARQLIERDKPAILLEFTPSAYPDARGFLDEIQVWYPLREVDEDGGLKAVTIEQILERKDFSMLWLEA